MFFFFQSVLRLQKVFHDPPTHPLQSEKKSLLKFGAQLMTSMPAVLHAMQVKPTTEKLTNYVACETESVAGEDLNRLAFFSAVHWPSQHVLLGMQAQLSALFFRIFERWLCHRNSERDFPEIRPLRLHSFKPVKLWIIEPVRLNLCNNLKACIRRATGATAM